MNFRSILMLAAALPVAFAAPAIAQDGKTLATVVNGNTTVEFQAAQLNDAEAQRLRTWSDFASQHPNIAHALAYKPGLLNDDGYLKKHPELGAFFSEHPDIKEAMAADPGDYNAIPPRPGE